VILAHPFTHDAERKLDTNPRDEGEQHGTDKRFLTRLKGRAVAQKPDHHRRAEGHDAAQKPDPAG
jgi:hypothetical protein